MRRLGISLGLPLWLGLSACKATAPGAATPPPSEVAGGGREEALREGPRAAVELIAWSLEAERLGEALDTGSELLRPASDAMSIDLRIFARTLLMQAGLDEKSLDLLDWERRFSAALGYPQPGQTQAGPEDLRLRARLPAKDPAAFLAALPQSLAPKAGPENSLQIDARGVPLLLRAGAGAVLMGRELEDLRASESLGREALPAQIRVRAENLHTDDLDPGAILPLPAALSEPFARALERARAAELWLDLARDTDLRAHLALRADLSDMGFDPLGPPRSSPSGVAARLPPGALFVLNMAWGDPKLVHTHLDRLTKQVPEPFGAWLADGVREAHALIDVVASELVLAIYRDEKGRVALVLAGDLRDAAKGQAALRGVLSALANILERYAALLGDDANYRSTISWKPEGLGFSKSKVDLLTASVPKAFAREADALASVVGSSRPKLELLAHVDASANTALVAVGEGARGVLADWVRALEGPRERSLESDAGLALARAIGGGCSLCVAADPVRVLALAHEFDGLRGDEAKPEGAGPPRIDLARVLADLPPGPLLALSLRAADDEFALGVAAQKAGLYGADANYPKLLQRVREQLVGAAP